MDYFLKSERLGFRCWSANDLALAMGLWGDPRVTAFIGGPFTQEKVRERLAREIREMETHGVQYWPIFLLESDQHAGCAGLRPYRPEQKVYELGVHLCQACWGKGFAIEASRAAIRYGFDVLGADALFAGHHPDNAASRRLLSKLGFEYTHEELYTPTGLMHPSYLLRKK
ncbi:MAG TPA: GNAT family N-acetyltransferase [Candidatus Acidoferrales bacterium]|nr:GNAT family N-acetyltransferase [Candidatus Acidoferrales bacterium]